jgi:biotin operon repressor
MPAARPARPFATGLEVELNEMRSKLAALSGKEAETLKAQLDAIQARVEAQEVARDPGAETRRKILRLLSTVNDGKPGYLSTPEIENRLGLTRSAAHTHIMRLEKDGMIWIRKTHGENGRVVFFNYHRDAVGRN